MPENVPAIDSTITEDAVTTEDAERTGGNRGLAWRLKVLQNEVFYKRYITRNIKHAYGHLFGFNPKLNGSLLALMWRAAHKVARNVKAGESLLRFLLKLHFVARFLRGKVDMPYIEVVVTTKCTLRCEACGAMMQYFSKETHYTCTLSGIKASLEALFRIVDSVLQVRIIGGEPLLYKDLAQLVRFLRESPNVRAIDLVTNGTLDFSEDVIEALAGSHKAHVTISDYKRSPNLPVPLRQESVIAALEKRGIAYELHLSAENSAWWDSGRIYKRGRPKEDVIKNYRACLANYVYPKCTSVMSSEGAKDANLAPAGAAFICAVASSLSRLKGLKEFEGDFIDLATASKERVIEFYAQDCFKACDYCQNMWDEKRFVTPAVQTKEVFSVEEGI